MTGASVSPQDISIDSATGAIYVTSSASGTLSVIESGAVSDTIFVGVGAVWRSCGT